MSSSFSLQGWGPTTIGLGRVVIVTAGLITLAVALYRTPVWLDSWNTGAVIAAITGAVTLLALAIGVAVRGKARAIERVSIELSLLACALIAAEAILLLQAPEKWADAPALPERFEHEQAARAQGIAYDGQLRAEVVAVIQSPG